MKLAKASGLGNSFAIIECKESEIDDAKKYGTDYIIESDLDTLLITYTDELGKTWMRVLEKDGSESMMCGNGLRALALYYKNVYGNEKIDIHTLAGIKPTKYISENIIKAKIGQFNYNKVFNDIAYSLHFSDVGEPHIVVFSNEENVKNIFNTYKNNVVHNNILLAEVFDDPNFPTCNLNVAWVDKEDPSILHHRVYERGVNDQTLACGTGASCVVGTYIKVFKPSLNTFTVRNHGGDMIVEMNESNDIFITGPAEVVDVQRI